MRVNWDTLDRYHYHLQVSQNIDDDSIIDAFTDFYVEIGLRHARKIGRSINKEIRKDEAKRFEPVGFAEEYPPVVRRFLRMEAGTKIKTVRQGLVAYVTDAIARGLEDGKDIRTISGDIQRLIGSRGFYRWQALRIARTETTAASNFGALQAGNTSGVVMKKVWVSSSDGRTRRIPRDVYDHRVMDGEEVDPDLPFEVPGKLGADLLLFPGDPRGEAGNVINCRCAVALVPARDKNGRLIYSGRPNRPGYRPRPKPPVRPQPVSTPEPRSGAFVPAKNISEVHERLKKFAPNADFDGLRMDKANEILKAVEEVLGEYRVKLTSDIGFQKRRRQSYGVAGSRFKQGSATEREAVYLRIQKTYARSAEKKSAENKLVFVRSKQYRIDQTRKRIERLEANPNAVKRDFWLERYRNDLEKLEALERWTVDPTGKSLYATTVHEAYHNVYYHHNVGKRWEQALIKYGVTERDKWRIGEYASTPVRNEKTALIELWPEVGVMYRTGQKNAVPKNIQKAFDEVIDYINSRI